MPGRPILAVAMPAFLRIAPSVVPLSLLTTIGFPSTASIAANAARTIQLSGSVRDPGAESSISARMSTPSRLLRMSSISASNSRRTSSGRVTALVWMLT